MKVLKVALKIDSFVQGLLLLGFLANAINGLIQFNFNYFHLGHLYLMFMLGVWQVTSGCVMVIASKDQKRIKYLMSVFFYFSFWVVLFFIFELLVLLPYGEILKDGLQIIYGYCIPILIGTYYFSITYKNMIRSHYFRRSFWDI